jgi:chorismate synthase
VTLRELHTVDECRQVVAVQEAVWGANSEIVPASVLLASLKRGGILLGAFDGDRMTGFVWSMPGWREGQPTQWSHMLGVVPDARGHGIGERLKREQRVRALAAGVDLIEWTFDPLQAPNAHLNLTTLGCVASTYLVDAYGAMSGPLHRGTATDRLIAEWWIRRPHVERRLAPPAMVARSSEVLEAPEVLEVDRRGTWAVVRSTRTDLDVPRVLVAVPARFTEMQRDASDVAQAWRMATREAFQAYFARGYRAVDFFLNRNNGGGSYLLAVSREP